MDTNENLLQINTFIKGMNTDISDMMLDPLQYRYAENLRLITDDNGNSGELRMIEGLKRIYTFEDTPIYINAIRNYVVVIIRSSEEWCIYSSEDNGSSWTKIFGDCTDILWKNGSMPHISGVLSYEAKDDIKFYFVDDIGKHGIMSINITIKQNIGDKIELLNGSLLYGFPICNVSISEQSGMLKCPRVQYAYRYYNNNGNHTDISPLSILLSLYKDEKQGILDGETTGKSVKIEIDNSSITTYKNIQIYRIEYILQGLKPQVYCIFDSPFNVSNFSVIDSGLYISQMSFEEFLSLNTIKISPKIICQKNNVLFAANIKYTLDDINDIFKDFDARSFSSGNCWDDDQPIQIDYTNHKVIERLNHTIVHKQYIGDDLEYNSEFWKTSDDLIGGDGPFVSWRLVKDFVLIDINNENVNNNTNVYKHDETYRFGIVLYDKFGNKSSVKWIADIRIPEFDANNDIKFFDENGDEISYYDTTNLNYNECSKIKYYTYNINFTINNIPNECCAVEIVRCLRQTLDKRVLFLGICSSTIENLYYYHQDDPFDETSPGYFVYGSDKFLFPSGYLTTQEFIVRTEKYQLNHLYYIGVEAKNKNDVVLFACPEFCYKPDDVKNIIDYNKSNISLCGIATFLPKVILKTYGQTGSEISLYKTKYKEDRKIDSFGVKLDGNIAIVDTETESVLYINGEWRTNNPQSIKWRGIGTFFNLFIPNRIGIRDRNIINDGTKINEISYVESPGYEDFANEKSPIFFDNNTPIGLYQFINWSTVTYNTASQEKYELEMCVENSANFPYNVDGDSRFVMYPIGSGGSSILFMLNKNIHGYQSSYVEQHPRPGINLDVQDAQLDDEYVDRDIFPIDIVNVTKKCYPYGGYNDVSILNSTYYSFGDYALTNGLNSITVTTKTGDGYIWMFNYNALHLWHSPLYTANLKMASVYMVPIESDINLRAQSGTQFDLNKSNSWAIQDTPIQSSIFLYTLEKPAYVYNSAYNQESVYSPLFSEKEIIRPSYETRIHSSSKKTSGETIDSWYEFRSSDYLDVDNTYGEITLIDNFKDSVIFWQKYATGLVSSNERNIIQNQDGVNLILGNGDVLQRYDYLSIIYGMEYGQFANAQSDNSEYWWDSTNKEILQYTKGGVPTPISTTKGVKTYLLYNSESQKPHVMYDNRYKEIAFNVVNDNCISYTEQLLTFLSIYTYPLHYSTHIDDDNLVVIGNKLFLANSYEEAGKANGIDVLLPKLKFIVNKNSTATKVFDLQTFGGRIYGGDDLSSVKLTYNTPLKLHGEVGQDVISITNREYDFRIAIPRHNNSEYGDRLRGKTMQCELSSTSNSTDFSLQYIITKYRISWS